MVRKSVLSVLSFVALVMLSVTLITMLYIVGQTPKSVVLSAPIPNVSPFGIYRQYYCQPGCRIQFHRVWELNH